MMMMMVLSMMMLWMIIMTVTADIRGSQHLLEHIPVTRPPWFITDEILPDTIVTERDFEFYNT